MKVAVIGVTGLVGGVMLEVLEERNFPITRLIPVASLQSVGQKVLFNSQVHTVVSIETALSQRPDIVLFSAGAEVSKEWAPKFAGVGSVVIDNSSAWRKDKTKKLIVPEINGGILTKNDKIIANPNCSTIQMLMSVYPAYELYGIDRLIISTYQAVSGSGVVQ